MVTTVYIVRHAEALGNIQGIFQGSIDLPITENGYRQLEALSERFKNIRYDAVYSSPLERARVTAEYINKNHGLEIKFEKFLEEINAGDFEGRKWSDLPAMYPNEYDAWKNSPDKFKAPNGETMKQVYQRMTCGMKKICAKEIGKTIVVVSHGCAVKNFLCYCNGWDNSKMNELGWSDNTAVSLVKFDEKFKPEIVFLNDSSHLTEDISTMRFQKWWK
ncbi:MAG: histidine phosphatase family protein [Ruminococcus sp.]|jgi:probable phosphoglycerate mutase|nr:histidine phosphatase family protein [Ruminococcus sp.]